MYKKRGFIIMIFVFGVVMVASAILASITGTVEYFTLDKITKSDVIAYRSIL
jgi:energy-converting hydrogenase Eha subunit H